MGLPWWLSGKESAYNAGSASSVPGLGKSHGEGNGYPLLYSCLGNPMGRGSLWVYGVTRSQTRLSDLVHTCTSNISMVRQYVINRNCYCNESTTPLGVEQSGRQHFNSECPVWLRLAVASRDSDHCASLMYQEHIITKKGLGGSALLLPPVFPYLRILGIGFVNIKWYEMELLLLIQNFGTVRSTQDSREVLNISIQDFPRVNKSRSSHH